MGYGVHHFALRPDRAIQMLARARRASRSLGGWSQPVGTRRVSTAIEQSLTGAPEHGLKGLTLDAPGEPTPGRNGPLSPALIGNPKLFTGGEESLRKLSPQPTVNNFARRPRRLVNKLCLRAKRSAVTPRWVTNTPAVSLDELGESFAPARRLGPKRILRCRQSDVSSIRPSLDPSQRGRNRKPRQH